MTKCKEDHFSMDYVECEDCDTKGCRTCEDGWQTDFNEGIRRCSGCVYWNKVRLEEVGRSEP